MAHHQGAHPGAAGREAGPHGSVGWHGAWQAAQGKATEQVCLAFPLQALLKTGEHSWSLAELIQALVLLTHCHSLASFVFGCGILPEGDPEGSPAPQAPSPPSEQSTPPSRDSLNHSGVSQGPESFWERKLGASGPWVEDSASLSAAASLSHPEKA